MRDVVEQGAPYHATRHVAEQKGGDALQRHMPRGGTRRVFLGNHYRFGSGPLLGTPTSNGRELILLFKVLGHSKCTGAIKIGFRHT